MTARSAIEQLVEATLAESPQLLPGTDFNWLAPDDNLAEFNRLAGLPVQWGEPIGPLSVGTTTDPLNGLFIVFAVDPLKKHLAFKVVVDDADTPGLGLAAVQVALWRSPQCVTGVPRRIFWEQVFTRHHCVLSDVGQTKDGRVFWRDRIAEALKRGLRVGLINTDNTRIFKIESLEQYSRIASVAYGGDDRYADFRFFIRE